MHASIIADKQHEMTTKMAQTHTQQIACASTCLVVVGPGLVCFYLFLLLRSFDMFSVVDQLQPHGGHQVQMRGMTGIVMK